MARLARVEYEGAIFHVTVRGNGRQELFKKDGDRTRVLEGIAECAGTMGIRVYAYCLMSNHIHLLVETPHANLGRFMQKWQTRYVLYFSRKYTKGGHVMQGRYGAKPVEGDRYLLNLIRYIHLNPVYIKAVTALPLEDRLAQLRHYPWSSYTRYRTGKGCDWVEEKPILALAGGRTALVRFTEEGVATKDSEFLDVYRGSRFGIGDEDFLLEMRDLYRAARKKRKREDLSLRREGRWIRADRIIGLVCEAVGVAHGEVRVRRREHDLRPMVSWLLGKYGGLTQRQIADHVGARTGRAISDQVRLFSERLKSSPALARRVARLESALEEVRYGDNL